MATEWYVRSGEMVEGPYSSAQLKLLSEEGRLKDGAQLRRGREGKWQRIALPSGDSKEATTPATAQTVGVGQIANRPTSKGMSRPATFACVFGLVTVGAFVGLLLHSLFTDNQDTIVIAQSSTPQERRNPPPAPSGKRETVAVGAQSRVLPAESSISKALIPKDAFIAVGAYPRRLLKSPDLSKFEISTLADAIAKSNRTGPPLGDVEQITYVAGGEGLLAGSRDSDKVFEAKFYRLAEPHGGVSFLAHFFPDRVIEPAEIGGHTFYRPARDEASPFAAECFYFIDDYTFLVSSLNSMHKILEGDGAETPLTKSLQNLGSGDDLSIVIVMDDTTSRRLSAEMADLPLSSPAHPFIALPQVLRSATLAVTAAPAISLKIDLEANNAAGAAKLADMVTVAKLTVEHYLPQLNDQIYPAFAKSELKFLEAVARELKPQQDGDRVSIRVNGLGTREEFFGHQVAPLMAEATEEAQRIQSRDNLKRLASAMRMHLGEHSTFPLRNSRRENDKPLLSWRVQVLPYLGLECEELFRQFRLDESWNSPHNERLISKMPAVFRSPYGTHTNDGQTCYVVPFGKNAAVFYVDDALGIASHEYSRAVEGLDGIGEAELPSTIVLLEVGADKAVPWTKPDDIEFTEFTGPFALGAVSEGGFLVALADGSVLSLPFDVNQKSLGSLIFRRDKEHPRIDPWTLAKSSRYDSLAVFSALFGFCGGHDSWLMWGDPVGYKAPGHY